LSSIFKIISPRTFRPHCVLLGDGKMLHVELVTVRSSDQCL